MGFHGIGQHHVFQHAALLADLQFAVTVGTFKVVVHVEQQFTNFGIFETEFFPKAPARRPGSVLDKFYPVMPGARKVPGIAG